MKNFKTIIFIFFMMCFSIKTHSQNNFSIHFGLSSPESDFAKSDVDDVYSGGAAIGINFGLQYIYSLAESGLGLLCGFDFNYNGLKEDYKNDMKILNRTNGEYFDEINFYKYMNIPISAGLNYTYMANEKIGVFANVGLALNFLKITDMEFVWNEQTTNFKFDLASNFGFKIGGGISIGLKHLISIDYLGLGMHDIDGTVSTSNYSSDFDLEQKVDLLTITYGFKF